jgi:hypothetical protein
MISARAETIYKFGPIETAVNIERHDINNHKYGIEFDKNNNI